MFHIFKPPIVLVPTATHLYSDYDVLIVSRMPSLFIYNFFSTPLCMNFNPIAPSSDTLDATRFLSCTCYCVYAFGFKWSLLSMRKLWLL